MPKNLVEVRHGQGDHNVAQKLRRQGREAEIPEALKGLHDWQYRLTPKGIAQARMAGVWIQQNLGLVDEYFDRRYVSPFIRTRETALHLGGAAVGNWLKDDRLIERSWGTYGIATTEERADMFGLTQRLNSLSSLYTQYDNGESIGYQTIYRVRSWLDTLHRDMSEKNVLAVTHGEFMWATRYVLENMLPEEWDQYDKDKSQSIRNCTILQYTRENPDTGELANQLGWRRIIYPDAPKESPFEGDWMLLPGKRYMTPEDLQSSIDAVPQIFGDQYRDF